jgi:hypothetical protein
MNTTTLTVECPIPGRQRGSRQPAQASAPKPRPDVTLERLPRVSRLMALALRFEQLVRDGGIADYAALAQLGHVSRARISQITNLALLAPDIQEALLFLSPIRRGRDPIHLRALQDVAALPNWQRQRALWQTLLSTLERTSSEPP